MHPEQLMAELAARLQLPKLAFNAEHVCCLVLDDRYLVNLEWVEPSRAIHVYSVIHRQATELQPRFAELLAANLFGHATGDAVLGVDLERDEIYLTRKFELEWLDIEWFIRQLDLFVDVVANWTEHLHRHNSAPDASEDSSPNDDPASDLLRV